MKPAGNSGGLSCMLERNNFYRTVKVSGIDLVTLPAVAVTLSAYVPEGVFVSEIVVWALPPQLLRAKAISNIAQAPASRHCIFPRFSASNIASTVVKKNATSHGNRLFGPSGKIDPAVPEVAPLV